MKAAPTDHNGSSGTAGIQVIERAAAILRALQKSSGGLTLGEIARIVGLPRSTVQRIVDALDRENFVIAPSSASGVRLGPGLIALAEATRFPILELARPTLEALAEVTGETVDLSVADSTKMVFVDQIPGIHRLAAVSAVGVSFPLHCSANGKAVLASLTPGELEKIRKRMRLTRYTVNTITSWRNLEHELETVRRTGIAHDREEQTLGIRAVGKALRSPNGELSAISIPVPTQRFLTSERALTARLAEHCEALQQRLN